MHCSLGDWPRAWEDTVRDWSNGCTPRDYDDFHDGIDAAMADRLAHGAPRGSPQWVARFLANRLWGWPRNARSMAEILEGLEATKRNIVALDETYRQHVSAEGCSYLPNYCMVYWDIRSGSAEFGIREWIDVPIDRAIGRVRILRYIDQVAAALRRDHLDSESMPGPGNASRDPIASDGAILTVQYECVMKGQVIRSVTLRQITPAGACGRPTRITGPTRAYLAATVFASPATSLRWEDILRDAVKSGRLSITSGKSLERQGRRVREALPPQLRGFWEQDGHGVCWTLRETTRMVAGSTTPPKQAA